LEDRTQWGGDGPLYIQDKIFKTKVPKQ